MAAPEITEKEQDLREELADLGEAVIAFSGGTDSTLLLAVAAEEIDTVLAVTARAPIFPDEELQRAKDLAERFGVEHAIIDIDPFEVTGFAENDPRRCYYCKRHLMQRLRQIADVRDIAHVLEASQTDDMDDYRPGMEALCELGIRSPLMDAGLGSRDVRLLSEQMDLPTADLPSMACFASRIPYGTRITPELIQQVADAEDVLRGLGIDQVRVRHHGEIARIEVAADEFERLLDAQARKDIVRLLKTIGFTYVTLDLDGYRTGSMNEALTGDETSGEG